MKIAEIYPSIQGEGFLSGTESVFVRASGCNLRCWYCDTPYASWSPEGEDLAVDEILARVLELGSTHVVITGGEPMLFAELIPLTAGLRARRLHITIETASTLYLPVECDLMSLSPKLSNSNPNKGDGSHYYAQKMTPVPFVSVSHWSERHERTRRAPEVIRRLVAEYSYQLKFVVDDREDCEEVASYLSEFPEIDRARVMLMPQGVDAPALAAQAAWLEPYCREHDLRFCPRKHIEWFGLTRGT